MEIKETPWNMVPSLGWDTVKGKMLANPYAIQNEKGLVIGKDVLLITKEPFYARMQKIRVQPNQKILSP